MDYCEQRLPTGFDLGVVTLANRHAIICQPLQHPRRIIDLTTQALAIAFLGTEMQDDMNSIASAEMDGRKKVAPSETRGISLDVCRDASVGRPKNLS